MSRTELLPGTTPAPSERPKRESGIVEKPKRGLTQKERRDFHDFMAVQRVRDEREAAIKAKQMSEQIKSFAHEWDDTEEKIDPVTFQQSEELKAHAHEWDEAPAQIPIDAQAVRADVRRAAALDQAKKLGLTPAQVSELVKRGYQTEQPTKGLFGSLKNSLKRLTGEPWAGKDATALNAIITDYQTPDRLRSSRAAALKNATDLYVARQALNKDLELIDSIESSRKKTTPSSLETLQMLDKQDITKDIDEYVASKNKKTPPLDSESVLSRLDEMDTADLDDKAEKQRIAARRARYVAMRKAPPASADAESDNARRAG